MSRPSHFPISTPALLRHTRLRAVGVAIVCAMSVVAWATPLRLDPLAVVISAAWVTIVLLEWWGCAVAARDQSALRRHGAGRLLASLVMDTVALTALIALSGGGWWITSSLYAFLIASSFSVLPTRHAWGIAGLAAGGVAFVLGAQVTGALTVPPFLGLPSFRGRPDAAIATFVFFIASYATFCVMFTAMLSQLRQRVTHFRTLVNTASDLVLTCDAGGRLRTANGATLELTGLSVGTLRGTALASLLHADDRHVLEDAISQAAGGDKRAALLRMLSPSGYRWLACTFAPLELDWSSRGVLGILRDVTDERIAAESVRNSEARLRAVFDQAALAFALADLNGTLLEVNAAMERMLDTPGPAMLGRSCCEFMPTDDHAAVHAMLHSLRTAAQESTSGEQRFVRADGRVLWALLTVSRVDTPNGEGSLMLMLQDITERRALEAQLKWQAFHDPLTNLANRALFQQRVTRSLAEQAPTPGSVAVIFLDLDNFKHINDSLGHAAGDKLLVEVARRLLNSTRGCDTVARLGGDEFAILLDNARHDADAVRVADRVLAAMQLPVTIDEREVIVGTSIGIVRNVAGDTAEDLLRNADTAMYSAKLAGKGRHTLFEPAMHEKAVERLRLEAALRNAVDHDELSLVFQPLVQLETGQPYGVEALARWIHPEYGPVSPSTFIPIAEETGLVVTLGRWVLLEACARVAEWNRQTGRAAPLSVSVNVSGRQLEDPALTGHVQEALVRSGLDARCLTLEITETALVEDSTIILDRLKALKALGVSLAIDDFGTGYSSLSYIQQFPVDVLKIDRTFVDGLKRGGSSDTTLARTIIALGRSLRLRTVAEGIETEIQSAILRELGCDNGQGFLYARPMPAPEAAAWLAQYRRPMRAIAPPPGPAAPAPPTPSADETPWSRRDTGEMAAIPA